MCARVWCVLMRTTNPLTIRDIMRGLPSELEWQVGAVARKAKALGVPAPASSLIYAALLPQELKARGKLAFSIE